MKPKIRKYTICTLNTNICLPQKSHLLATETQQVRNPKSKETKQVHGFWKASEKRRPLPPTDLKEITCFHNLSWHQLESIFFKRFHSVQSWCDDLLQLFEGIWLEGHSCQTLQRGQAFTKGYSYPNCIFLTSQYISVIAYQSTGHTIYHDPLRQIHSVCDS